VHGKKRGAVSKYGRSADSICAREAARGNAAIEGREGLALNRLAVPARRVSCA
jgi:hypothetical protein